MKTPEDSTPKKQKQREEKTDRLAGALRDNLRKRKSLQRGRGEQAPAPIKNKNRLTD